MAHAMLKAGESAFGQNLPRGALRESGDGYQFLFQRQGEEIAMTSVRGEDHATGLIQWVMGAGRQGETPLVSAANGELESRISYFTNLKQYGITIGQPAAASPNAVAALGRRQGQKDLASCIGCHATAVTRDLEPVVPGVQCQRCHPGADEHASGGKTAPLNPGKMGAAQQVRFCGNCHRNQAPVDGQQLENVRFQPLRLMKSRCFASGQLACTTCHPAHQDARRADAAFYDEKCRICHEGHADHRKNEDCIGCHMPYVQLHPALQFTDHYIRIVKRGDLPEENVIIRPTGSL